MSRPSGCGSCGECEKCKRAAYMREWYRRPGNAQAQRESQAASRARRIDEIRAYDRARGHRVYSRIAEQARNAVHKALRRGHLERKPCEVCGAAWAEAHHDDYAKPLAVRWLCKVHHMEHHRLVA